MTKKQLKAHIAQLESDLTELVTNPNGPRAMVLKFTFKIMSDIEEQAWYGTIGQAANTTGIIGPDKIIISS